MPWRPNQPTEVSPVAVLIYHVFGSPSFALYSQQAHAPAQGAAESCKCGSRAYSIVCDRDMPAACVALFEELRAFRGHRTVSIGEREGEGLRRFVRWLPK
jgi:hypothetical protein